MAPLKKLSIPRLELTAAVILARLIKTVQIALRNQIELNEVFCWGGGGEGGQYNCFGLAEKGNFELTKSEMWRHCPTDSNPVDIGTRGESREKQIQKRYG